MSESASVHWAELLPDDFRRRCEKFPIVYLPLGLCEPHGHIAALGLDLLKAEFFCAETARRFGGIVAPAQGYHIHESGFHAPWLAQFVGNTNPYLAAFPPHVMLHLFLYQLRSFALAGFHGVIAISGHAGGSQEDLRRVADSFSKNVGLPVIVKTDPEWLEGLHPGDHAGRYEISQLMAIRPDLVDLSRLRRQHEPDSGGRLALGDDAGEASIEFGRTMNEAVIAAAGKAAADLASQPWAPLALENLTYSAMETLWHEIYQTLPDWRSVQPYPDQTPPDPASRWHPYTDVREALHP
jgi:creatinine amidohydrolase